MQQTLVAGDSLNFATSTPDYPASAGWVLKYRLVPRGTGSAIELTATAEGDDHRVQVAAATTAGWSAGAYGWAAWVEKTGEQYTVDSGQITVTPNPRTVAAGTDLRSEARKALEDLKTAHAAYVASNGTVASYQIADRQRTFRSVAEIVKLITYYEQQVAKEDALAGRTEKIGRRIFSRI